MDGIFVAIDADERVYPAVSLSPYYWNGFASPRFAPDVARRIVADRAPLHAECGSTLVVVDCRDGSIVLDLETVDADAVARAIAAALVYGADVVLHSDTVAGVDCHAMPLETIGAMAWTWQRVDAAGNLWQGDA